MVFAGQRTAAARVLAGRGCLSSLAALSRVHQAPEPHGRPQQEAEAGAAQCLERHRGPHWFIFYSVGKLCLVPASAATSPQQQRSPQVLQEGR